MKNWLKGGLIGAGIGILITILNAIIYNAGSSLNRALGFINYITFFNFVREIAFNFGKFVGSNILGCEAIILSSGCPTYINIISAVNYWFVLTLVYISIGVLIVILSNFIIKIKSKR